MGKHICQWYIRQGLTHKICKELIWLNTRKTNNSIKMCAKDLNRYFSKEDIRRAQSHMKECSASQAIREMQTETTMRYHFTPVRMAIINKSTNNKCWRGCGEKKTREKEGAYTLCNSMDGTGDHYAKWNKPGCEGQIPYDLTFNWNIINKRKK